MLDISIEYCHVYTGQPWTLDSAASITQLHQIIDGLEPDSYELVIMVDDYSSASVNQDEFDYALFMRRLSEKMARPGVLVQESSLVTDNLTTIKRMPEGSHKTQLVRYINKTGRHPCSLFIATWYLQRLGIISSTRIHPAERLVNVLPAHYAPAEERALDYIIAIAGEEAAGRIHNEYVKSPERYDDYWDNFDPEAYLFTNYTTIYPHDVYMLDLMVTLYRERRPKYVLEVGCGPNLFPVLAALPYVDGLQIVENGKHNLDYLASQFNALDGAWARWTGMIQLIDPSLERFNFLTALRHKAVVNQGSIYDLPAGKYDAASMHYVAESITDDPARFKDACCAFRKSIVQGGFYAASFMENSHGYRVGEIDYPAVPVSLEQVQEAMSPGILSSSRLPVNAGGMREGYSGTIHIIGQNGEGH